MTRITAHLKAKISASFASIVSKLLYYYDHEQFINVLKSIISEHLHELFSNIICSITTIYLVSLIIIIDQFEP